MPFVIDIDPILLQIGSQRRPRTWSIRATR